MVGKEFSYILRRGIGEPEGAPKKRETPSSIPPGHIKLPVSGSFLFYFQNERQMVGNAYLRNFEIFNTYFR